MNEKQVKDAIRATDAAPTLAEPKLMYMAHFGLGKIEPINVVKETAKMVGIREDGVSRITNTHKETNYHQVFGTWCEAHAALLSDARQKVHKARARLRAMEDGLKKIEEMSKN